jgi:hypothetical protein
MLDRLWTFPSGQLEKSPLNSRVPVLVVVVVGVVVDVGVVVVVVDDVLVLVVGVVVVVLVVVGVVVVVEVEVVVVVGGGGVVGLCTTRVGFDVLTAEPFLLLALTTRRSVWPTSAALSK